jgi:hypothetical protein
MSNVEILEIIINPKHYVDKNKINNTKTLILNYKEFFPNVFISNKKNETANSINNYISKRRTLKGFIKKIFINLYFSSPVFVSNNLKNTILSFKPDFIYSFGADLPVLKLIKKICKFADFKIVFHHMDNWIELANKQKVSLLKFLYKKSTISLAISNELSESLSKRFNVKHLTLSSISDFEGKPKISNKNLSIGFFGGLHLDRDEILVKFLNVFSSYFSNNNLKISFHAYLNDPDYSNFLRFENSPFIQISKRVPYETALKKMANFDFLIHFESFYNHNHLFTKYSISTKISDYISSGTPILYIGRNNSSISKLIERNSIGFQCNDLSKISVLIESLIANNDDFFEKLKYTHNTLFSPNYLKIVLNTIYGYL